MIEPRHSTRRTLGAAVVVLLALGCGPTDATDPRVGGGSDFSSGPSSIVKVSGTDQNGEAGEPLGEPFQVAVVNELGEGVPNVRVRWSVVDGGGSLSRETSTTDARGRAETRLTLGPATGKNSVQASAETGRSLSLTAIFVARATVLPVRIVRFEFRAPDGSGRGVMELGDTVAWRNRDSLPHRISVTEKPEGAAGFESDTVGPGESFRAVPGETGRWEYRCTLHPERTATGVLRVQPPS